MTDESMPSDDPLGLDPVDQDIHINEMEEELRAMGVSLSHAGDGVPKEIHEAFLQSVIAYERAPLSTHFEELTKAGVELPEPQSMDDDTLHAKLWEVIAALAKLSAYLFHTDHLSDRELYTHLWSDTLHEIAPIIAPDSGGQWFIDLVSSGSEEDIENCLRHYDTEEERRRWAEDFPETVIPPHEKPPFDRDRLLPRGMM